MKTIIRIFNIVIMALSAVATVMLFATPTFSLNSNIAISTDTFNKVIPENEYTGPIDVASVLGTDSVHFAIKFNFGLGDVQKAMKNDKNVINDMVVTQNINELADTFYEPVDIITEYAVRTVIKKVVKDEITNQIEKARTSAAIAGGSTAQDIMDEVGIDDAYFSEFSRALYEAANEDGATVGSFTNVLYWQIDEAVKKADAGTGGVMVDEEKFGEEQKAEIKSNFLSIFNQLKLIKEDTTVPEDEQSLVKISHLSYLYLSTQLKTQLETKVSDVTVLDQKMDETLPQYTKRLVNIYVTTLMPEAFYSVVGYVSLGLFIGVFVFAALWAFLLVFTLIKTFTKKPWTTFGPWFWVIGLIQLVLGLGLTVFGKFILPTMNINLGGGLLKSFVIAPRTFALIPSMIYLVCIVLGIVYAVFKHMAKKQYKEGGAK